MRDTDWRFHARCGNLARSGEADPEWWHTGAGALSGENRKAVRHCLDCPVRVRCRDDALALARSDRRPVSTILGGWVWREMSLLPSPGDEDLAEEVPGYDPAGRPRRSRIALDGRLFASARDYLDGVASDEVCRRHDVDQSSMRQGALILLGAPELVDDVEAGLMSIVAAMEVARSRMPEGRVQLRPAGSAVAR